jgi:hypothetical protein
MVLNSQVIACRPCPDETIEQNGVLPMKQTFVTARLWIVRVALFSWLVAVMSAGSAQAATVSYTLDNIFLDATNQMTGTFEWTYVDDDFENGTGVFSELFIPFTTRTLDELNFSGSTRIHVG